MDFAKRQEAVVIAAVLVLTRPAGAGLDLDYLGEIYIPFELLLVDVSTSKSSSRVPSSTTTRVSSA